MEEFNEYQIVKDFYGDKTAKRSGVPLIIHINEGLFILTIIGASDDAKRAYCMHPLVQSDIDFADSWYYVSSITSPSVLLLAMEYRNIANQYLSHRTIYSIDEISLSPIFHVND